MAEEPAIAGIGLAGLLTSLGQALLVLDADFRVVRAFGSLGEEDELTPCQVEDRPARDLFGHGLFGDSGALRLALEAGERRDGWRTSLHLDDEDRRLVTVTAAPLEPPPDRPGGRRDAAYAVLMRPVGSGAPVTLTAPTVYGGMAARSAAMQRVFRLIEDLRESLSTVLITGESGTGKELVARALHRASPRRDGPFVAVNCAGLAENLIESELFGHLRGSFTGALHDRVGRFEAANGGTLLLDEVGDLPPSVQVKLLRVLQERSFERVGESRARPFDARILAATHVDLKRAIEQGRFREDLYYRLRVVTCHLPPLRERPEDIESVVTYLLAAAASADGRRWVLSPETLGAFLRYSWPGNVRELANALEHAFAVGKPPTIEPEDLPAEILLAVTDAELEAPATVPPPVAVPTRWGGGALDREALRAVLEANRWRRRETAEALGVSRTSLWRRMRDLGLLR